MVERRSGKSRTDDGILGEISSFRREAMKVSDDDMRSWRNEVLRTRGDGEAQKKGGAGLRRRANPAIPFAVLLLAAVALTLSPKAKRPGPSTGSAAPLSVAASVAVTAPVPVEPAESEESKIVPASVADFDLMFETALADWELSWARPRILAHFPRPHAFEGVAPWAGLPGPARAFAPFSSDQPHEVACRVLDLDPPPSPQALVGQLASILGQPRDPATEIVECFLVGDDRAVAEAEDGVLKSFEENSKRTQAVSLLQFLSKCRLAAHDEAIRSAVSELGIRSECAVSCRALVSLALGDVEGAERILVEGEAAYPEAGELFYRRVWIRRLKGDEKSVRDLLASRMESRPADPYPRLIQGAILMLDEDRFSLQEVLQPLVASLPAYTRSVQAAIQGMAADLENTPAGHSDRAQSLLEKSESLNPGGVWTHLSGARSGILGSRRIAVLDGYRAYLDLAPSLAIRKEFAEYLVKQGSLAPAFSEYGHLRRAALGDPSITKAFRELVINLNQNDLARQFGIALPSSGGETTSPEKG